MRRTQRTTLTATLCPYTTLFRAGGMSAQTPSNPLTEKERMATIALGAIKKLDANYEARPLPGTENSIRLNRKAVDCELRDRCKTCILECAVVPERLAWWEKELARVGGVPRAALIKDKGQRGES